MAITIRSAVRRRGFYGAENNYRLAAKQLAEQVDGETRIIYLVDPNNPLGICYTSDEIRVFCEIAWKVGAYVLHDCTYRHFADNHVVAATIYPERSITIYSFSKWLSLVGLRVGAVVANKGLSDLASKSTATLGCSVIAQRAAQAGLAVKQEWMPKVQRAQRRNQTVIKSAVDKIPGLRVPVYPSQGNFLVIECADLGLRPEALAAVFAERGIMIRRARLSYTAVRIAFRQGRHHCAE
jgi:aspartate/methionine/tyrosine aminotransferase